MMMACMYLYSYIYIILCSTFNVRLLTADIAQGCSTFFLFLRVLNLKFDTY